MLQCPHQSITHCMQAASLSMRLLPCGIAALHTAADAGGAAELAISSSVSASGDELRMMLAARGSADDYDTLVSVAAPCGGDTEEAEVRLPSLRVLGRYVAVYCHRCPAMVVPDAWGWHATAQWALPAESRVFSKIRKGIVNCA